MVKRNRQKIEEGAIFRILISDERIAFGRLLPGNACVIDVFDFLAKKNEILSIDEIAKKPVLFYCGVYRKLITTGFFEIIGTKPFLKNEINKLPAFFTQDLVDINDCTIFWIGGGERKASPQDCIGIERSSVWEAEGLIQRIEDHYAGRKNFTVENQKVILSKDDPRYLPPPQTLRWDFDKQKFYRTDKLGNA